MTVAAAESRISGRVRGIFAQAGARGWLHAVDLADPAVEVAVDADEEVILASVFKLPLLVELFRQVDAGRVDPTELILITDRTPGATGLAAMRDPIRISLRDLAFSMISVSDVAATDVLLKRVGEDSVNAMLKEFGLARTRVRGTCRAMLESVRADLEGLDASRTGGGLRTLDIRTQSAGTPRELTRLLAAVWSDEAASPSACAEVRTLLASQVWPHRLSAGFPSDRIAVAGKTGTLPSVRNEVGVVELPDGRRYAVAVFTRSDSLVMTLPQVDAAIGAAARVAVEDVARRSK